MEFFGKNGYPDKSMEMQEGMKGTKSEKISR